MKNLFDTALEIRYNKFLLNGLTEICNSTVFPAIPIPLQQKVDKLMHELANTNHASISLWGSQPDILDDFIAYLDKKDYSHPLDSKHTFVTNTSGLIKQYIRSSVRKVREALKDLQPQDLEISKKRKK